jgi:hypothetical protein
MKTKAGSDLIRAYGELLAENTLPVRVLMAVSAQDRTRHDDLLNYLIRLGIRSGLETTC